LQHRERITRTKPAATGASGASLLAVVAGGASAGLGPETCIQIPLAIPTWSGAHRKRHLVRPDEVCGRITRHPEVRLFGVKLTRNAEAGNGPAWKEADGVRSVWAVETFTVTYTVSHS